MYGLLPSVVSPLNNSLIWRRAAVNTCVHLTTRSTGYWDHVTLAGGIYVFCWRGDTMRGGEWWPITCGRWGRSTLTSINNKRSSFLTTFLKDAGFGERHKFTFNVSMIYELIVSVKYEPRKITAVCNSWLNESPLKGIFTTTL